MEDKDNFKVDSTSSFKGHVPLNANPNYGNRNSPPPKTDYENRRFICRREEVNKVTKGKYGRNNGQ